MLVPWVSWLAAIVSAHNPGVPRWAWAGIVVLGAFTAGMVLQKALAWIFRVALIVLGVLVAWRVAGGGLGAPPR